MAQKVAKSGGPERAHTHTLSESAFLTLLYRCQCSRRRQGAPRPFARAALSFAPVPSQTDTPLDLVSRTCWLVYSYGRVCKRLGPGLPTWMPRQTPDSIQTKPQDWFWHVDRNGSTMTPEHIWERWLMTVGVRLHILTLLTHIIYERKEPTMRVSFTSS